MAQTIKLKRSATSGAIPTTSSLALGEVAINTYDGKMYIKKDVGGTETVVQVGAGADSVSYLEAGMIEYEYTATSNQTSFSGSDDNSATLSYIAESIMVFVNGVLQDDGVDYTASNGTSVVFGTGLAAADEVRIVAFTNVTTTGTLQDPTKLDAISTVNNQAAYSLTLSSSAYTPSSQNALIVSLNGITQEPGDSFTISGSTITFSPALVTGDVIDYIIDMGRAVTIGEYSGDLAVGGELEVAGDIIGDLRGSTLFKAQAGEALSKGSVVYISGISGNTTVVSKADANDAAKMPSFGVAAEAVSANNPVDIYTFGLLSGLDTSSYSEGDELFVSNTAGTLTDTPPAGESSKLQKIAKVTRSHASAGSIFIMGAGRSNAVPNLDDGDIFIGNSSNQAVTAALDTSIVPESGNLYYTDARVDSRLASGNVGNITTTGYLRGPSTFTIDPAAHGDNTGTLVVAGNLQVDGTQTTINSTTMTVDDLNLTLASGAANAAAANGAGITIDGASASLTYNGTNDDWNFNKDINVTGRATMDSLTVDGAVAINSNSFVQTAATPAYKLIESDVTDENTQLIQASGTFRIRTVDDAGSNAVERMRIDHGTGDISFYEDTGTTAKLFWDASTERLGIGTDAPTEKLSVVGDINLNPESTSSADRLSTRYIGKRDSGTVGWMANIGFEGTGSSGFATDIVFNTRAGDFYNSATTEKVRITSAGYVGIGGQVPDKMLLVSGVGAEIVINDTDSTDTPRLRLRESGATSGSIHTDGGDLILSSGTSERMRIDNAGNVGIGTTNPGYPLDVIGTLRVQHSGTDTFSTIRGPGNRTLRIDIDANGDTDSLTVRDLRDGSDRFTVQAGGSVGIGTSNPSVYGGLVLAQDANTSSDGFAVVDSTLAQSAKLWCDGVNAYLSSGNTGSDPLILNTGGGNVGIGITNPSAKLHVDMDDDDTDKYFHGGGVRGLQINDTTTAGNNGDQTNFHKASASGSYNFSNVTLSSMLHLDSNGSVGIGTNSPAQLLHLKSNDPLIRFEDDEGGAAVVYECGSAQGQFTVKNVTQSTQPFAINDSGLVRIGQSTAAPNPDALLHLHKDVNAGAVTFGDEASQVISTNTTAAGVQGYIGSLFFGTQDISSATQYAWRAAGIAGYLASDLGTAGATADLLFYTANASQTPTEKMRITSGGNVGIGIAPTDKLHLAGTAPQIIKLECTDNSLVSNQVVGALQWRTNDPSGSGVGDCAQIAVRSASTVGGSFIMQFNVASTTALNQEAMRLDRNGNLLIGGIISSPAARLVVFSTGNGSTAYDSGHTGIHINNENATAGNGNYGGGISFSRFQATADDQSAAIVPVQTTTDQDHMGLAFLIHDTNTRANPLKEAVRIDGDGIKFNGDTAAANALDDYEEGTWEPTLIGQTSNPSVTYHSDTGGYYVKTGRMVFVTGTVRNTAYSGGSGYLQISNLPFGIATRSNGDNSDGVGVAQTNIWNGSSTEVPTFIKTQHNTSRLYIGRSSDSSVTSFLDAGDWGSTCMMSFTIVYYTN